MVLVRKRYFRIHCQDLLQHDKIRRRETLTLTGGKSLRHRVVDPADVTAPTMAEPLRRSIPDRIYTASPAETQLTAQLSRYTITEDRRSSHGGASGSDEILNDDDLIVPTVEVSSPTDTRSTSQYPVALSLDRAELRKASFLSRISARRTSNIPLRRRSSASTIPAPIESYNSGMGGFPIMSRLSQVISSNIHLHMPAQEERPILLTRQNTGSTDDWSDAVRHRIVSWLPEGIAGLIVGRNSHFFTDELDDDELEQIGGVEYRALRFLSYFVATVSLQLRFNLAVLALIVS